MLTFFIAGLLLSLVPLRHVDNMGAYTTSVRRPTFSSHLIATISSLHQTVIAVKLRWARWNSVRENFSMTVWMMVFLSIECISAFAQDRSATLPPLVSFVAPAYPRIANDARMTGTTVTHVNIGKDGHVIEVKTVSAHPLFAKHVLDALKQWRFAPSDEEHEFDVTVRFEFYDPKANECFAPDGRPTTPETIVSAALPTDVLVRTTGKCWIITNYD